LELVAVVDRTVVDSVVGIESSVVVSVTVLFVTVELVGGLFPDPPAHPDIIKMIATNTDRIYLLLTIRTEQY